MEYHYFSKSTLTGGMREKALKILADHIAHPDPGSEFEKTVAPISHLPPKHQMDILLSRNYDVMLSYSETELRGYVALRWDKTANPSTIHVFRVWTDPLYRGNGIGAGNLAKIIEDSFGEYEFMQAGKGKDNDMAAVVRSFKRKHAERLNVNVEVETGRISRR